MWHFREPGFSSFSRHASVSSRSFAHFSVLHCSRSLPDLATTTTLLGIYGTLLLTVPCRPARRRAPAAPHVSMAMSLISQLRLLFPLCYATRLHISHKATRFSVATPSLLASKKNNSPERAPRAYKFRPIRRWLAPSSGPFGWWKFEA
jgi:hypothetical protein